MKLRIVGMFAAAALAAVALPAAAQSNDDEALGKRLADAQKRLEDAAREIAELSAAAGREGLRTFEHFLPTTRRAMLGVNLGAAEPNGGGVRVESVSPGGPAADAGVRAGDVIVAISTGPIRTGRDLVRVMETIEPGQKVELGLRRDGKPVTVTVESRAFDRAFLAGVLPEVRALRAVPAYPGQRFGWDPHWLLDDWGDAELVTLTPDLGRYFGAEKGVLVARAPEDGSLGLKDGDVIVAIGGREPQNGPHAMRILRSYQPGETVEFRILRDRRSQTQSATIPERASRDVPRRHLTPRTPPTPPTSPTPPTPPAAVERPAPT